MAADNNVFDNLCYKMQQKKLCDEFIGRLICIERNELISAIHDHIQLL